MATQEQKQALTALYVGYFDRAPDPDGLQFWIDQIDGGREFNTIAADFAASAEAEALYPYLTTPDVSSPAAFITNIYANLFGRVPDNAGLEFWSGVLEDGSVSVADMIEAIIMGARDDAEAGTFDKSVLDNKVEVGLDWATSTGDVPGFEFDAAAKAAAVASVNGVTEDEATVVAAKAATDAFVGGAANPGDTFTLTAGQDAVTGTEGNDTFLGLVDGANNTFTLGDVINGLGGTDTVRITTDQADTSLASVTLSNIEMFTLDSRGTDIGSVDVAGEDINTLMVDGNGRVLTAAAEVVGIDTSVDLHLEDIDANGFSFDVDYNENNDPSVVNISLVDVDDADMFIDMDLDDDGSSDSDVLNLTLDGVMNTDGDMSIYGGDVETFNVTVESASEVEYIGFYYNDDSSEFTGNVNLTLNGDLTVADYWDLSDDDTDSLFTITGSGNLDINELDDSDGDSSVDATAATGNIAIAGINNEASFVNTGSGDDEIGLEGSTTTVSLGAGDDMVSVGAAFVLDTSGATDVVDASFDGGDGIDTFEISAANALQSETNVAASTDDVEVSDALTGFERLSLSAFAGQTIDATLWGLGDDVTLAGGYGTGGSLTVNDAATVTLEEGTNTDISLIVDGADAVGSTDDSLTVVLESDDGDDYSDVTIADVETVNIVSSEVDSDDTVNTNTMDLIAAAAETLNISGEAALDLQEANTDLTAVETVNASGFDAGLTIDVSSAAQAVTITTGAGADVVVGSDFADTISVGNGGNTVTGGLGGDDITLGAGVTEDDVDTIVYNAVTGSQGVNVDTITGFQVAVQSTDDVNSDTVVDADDVINDILDFSGIDLDGDAMTNNAGSYLGEANGYGAVLTALSGGGDAEAVLDTSTSTLYLDANGDGILNDSDMAIELTGVTELSGDNFIFA